MRQLRLSPRFFSPKRLLSTANFYKSASMTPISELPSVYPALKLHPTSASDSVDIKSTREANQTKEHWKRVLPRNFKNGALKKDFTDATYGKVMSEQEALQEASRCLKCADAPCQKGCPSRVNIKYFIQQIASKNYYGAAKTILSSNPVGMTCGLVCATSDLCGGNCNLANSHDGPIDIGALQYFALKRFQDMQVKPTKPEIKFTQKIALVGAGPASLSCATYLARLGYGNITIFEKAPYAGGISAGQIPNFRLPANAVNYEVELLQNMGVKLQYNTALGSKELPNVESLRKEYDAVFLGVGLSSPITDNALASLTSKNGYWSSREFLTAVSEASKADLSVKHGKLPSMKGRVAVLGCGDTALDCARSAFRCGASSVTLVFFEDTLSMKANREEVDQAILEKVELMPRSLTKKVLVKAGKITGLQLYHTDGQYTKKEGQEFTMQFDHVVSAFGSRVGAELKKAVESSGLKLNKQGVLPVSVNGATDAAGVFAGGDLIGSRRTVEAANDGRTAAWGIHTYLQAQANNTSVTTEKPVLPGFQTEIDKVDVSVTMAGIKFPNPFGLASAPGANSLEMMRRAFHEGWGFVSIKTFTNDKDVVTNISPRIMSSMQAGQKAAHYQGGFMNIELIGEKYTTYWLNAIRKLKQEFGNTRVVIGSIMAAHNKEDWQTLAKQVEQAGADAIELNLSCPHGMHEKGMGLAIGTRPDWVKDVCSWVRSGTELPFFAKLTPNVTDITVIAQAAIEGGATGVTAINTVSGLVGLHFDATPYRMGVGKNKDATYGGLCGNIIRPLGLRAVSAIARKIPGANIMGVGGVDSGDVALQYIYAGASVVQVSSAIMNQEYSIVNDYITGLKTALYIRGRQDLVAAGYDFQSAPELHRRVPSFGPYELEYRVKQMKERKLPAPTPKLPAPQMKKVPTLNELIGIGCPRLMDHGKLPREEQTVMQVNPDLCLRCGKCMMACNDSGYMAFSVDEQTHLPTFDEHKCTGCGLCESVCPSNGCITFRPRGYMQQPERGKNLNVH
eukprot:TRINITY_DN2320_c0_g1_i1.p1 TRINITY_DN2320_c0_g1~~TRINITY_DN2320_c0_g1_i1.p1  ORF type:complete len:1020 (+),score=299.16 TRINITY_DN2320_c0_g1_i1:89-3148(+)